MARVFLSYDREDADRARAIAFALEKAGHSVWWDLHIKSGAQYNKAIEQALQQADAVVVLWSERSVESAWVRDEAAAGRDSGRLVPVALDDTAPPLGFRQFQTIDLSRWKGRGKPAQLRTLLNDVAATGEGAKPAFPSTKEPAPPQTPLRRNTRWLVPVVVLAAVALVVTAMLWRPWDNRSRIPVVAVAAAESSAMSQALARDLLTKLGILQGARASSMNLAEYGKGAGRNADLIVEVGGITSGQQAEANLMLLSGSDRSLLWSHEFQQPRLKLPDLKQQLAFTAAHVLGCALEAFPADRPRLKQQTLKLYLSGCAALVEAQGGGARPAIQIFRNVIREAPNFEGAWAKLLIAETDVFLATGRVNLRQQLAADIIAARKVNPDLPEAYQVEIDLLPQNAFAERIRVADRAVERNPDHPAAFAARAGVLEVVGRINEAVTDARRAMELDPLSPARRVFYIQTLGNAGQRQAALEELQEAERLWPGATNVAFMRFGFNVRYGDPREALRYIVSGRADIGWSGGRSFLEARADPTPAKIAAALKDAHRLYRREPQAIFHLAQAYGEFNREEELLGIFLAAPEADAIFTADVMFRPMLREFWLNPRSLLYARRVGLLQYWQSSGKWPDFCFEPDLPYDCKKEAAKLTA